MIKRSKHNNYQLSLRASGSATGAFTTKFSVFIALLSFSLCVSISLSAGFIQSILIVCVAGCREAKFQNSNFTCHLHLKSFIYSASLLSLLCANLLFHFVWLEKKESKHQKRTRRKNANHHRLLAQEKFATYTNVNDAEETLITQKLCCDSRMFDADL